MNGKEVLETVHVGINFQKQCSKFIEKCEIQKGSIKSWFLSVGMAETVKYDLILNITRENECKTFHDQ